MVAGNNGGTVPVAYVSDPEIWVSAFQSQGFGFIGECAYASVVVAQHHNGHCAQTRIENTLARHKEIVAVNKPYHNPLRINVSGIA